MAYKTAIRPMADADIDAVVTIEQHVQTHPWTRSQFLDSLKKHQCHVITVISDRLGFATLADQSNGEVSGKETVVGFCIMQPVLDEANLLLMAISPKLQGQGLGFRLLQYAVAALGEKCSQIFLEVRQSNAAAIALYEKSQFHQIDQRKNYYPVVGGGHEAAVIMVRMLKSFDFSS